MKTLFLSIFTFVAILLTSCDDTGTMCTTEFITYNLYVKGDTLTDFYTIRISTNDTIRDLNEGYFPTDNYGRRGYAILNDGYRKILNGKKEGFVFIGEIDAQIVIQELYIFGAGECHVYKESGKEIIEIE